MLSVLPIYFCLFFGYSQSDYPKPPHTATRLFYIQHSNNHNTYVYDANLKGGIMDSTQLINEYRIIYTRNGIKKPLSAIQRKLAYGMILLDTKPDLFKLRLAATNKISFYLVHDESARARIFVTVNEHKMYLDRMFVQLKEGFLGIINKVDYVLFYGEDYNSGQPVLEKVTL